MSEIQGALRKYADLCMAADTTLQTKDYKRLLDESEAAEAAVLAIHEADKARIQELEKDLAVIARDRNSAIFAWEQAKRTIAKWQTIADKLAEALKIFAVDYLCNGCVAPHVARSAECDEFCLKRSTATRAALADYNKAKEEVNG